MEPDQDLPSSPVLFDSRFTLAAYLKDRDEPCPVCRYNLRNLTTRTCPECGTRLRFGLSRARPYLRAWIALIVALLMPAGVGVLLSFFLAIALVMAIRFGMSPFSGVSVAAILLYLYPILTIPLSVMAITMRRKFLRLKRFKQWTIAGLAMAVPILCLILIVLIA